MGPTGGPSGADRTQVGPMLAPWTLLSGSFENCQKWNEYIIHSDPNTSNRYIESVFIEINNDALTSNRNIVIEVIYRIPNTNIKDFNAQIASVLEQLCIYEKLVWLDDVVMRLKCMFI